MDSYIKVKQDSSKMGFEPTSSKEGPKGPPISGQVPYRKKNLVGQNFF